MLKKMGFEIFKSFSSNFFLVVALLIVAFYSQPYINKYQNRIEIQKEKRAEQRRVLKDLFIASQQVHLEQQSVKFLWVAFSENLPKEILYSPDTLSQIVNEKAFIFSESFNNGYLELLKIFPEVILVIEKEQKEKLFQDLSLIYEPYKKLENQMKVALKLGTSFIVNGQLAPNKLLKMESLLRSIDLSIRKFPDFNAINPMRNIIKETYDELGQ